MDNKANEELVALQYKLHKEWLQHPVTTDVRKVLVARFQHYKTQLQEGILVASNEKQEAALRTAMTTCMAIESLLFDPSIFVKELNKINK